MQHFCFFPINGSGMGHLSRCLSYARRLESRAYCSFFNLASAIEYVERMGFAAEYFISPFWSSTPKPERCRVLRRKYLAPYESIVTDTDTDCASYRSPARLILRLLRPFDEFYFLFTRMLPLVVSSSRKIRKIWCAFSTTRNVAQQGNPNKLYLSTAGSATPPPKSLL